MDAPTRDDLRALIEHQHSICVSIYMPTYRAGAETQQNPIRLKNLLREAEERLEEAAVRSPEARQLLAPGRDLLDNSAFWRQQSDGLALFLAHDDFRSYRVPLDFEQRVVVNDRCYIKPLVPLLAGDGEFYILAVSQNGVRLLHGTRSGVSTVRVNDMPESLADALKFDDPERQLQFHTGTSAPGGGGGDRAAMFHGHGVGKDDEKTDILRYFHLLNGALEQVLADKQRVPLIFAGVDYLLPIYQEANTYGWLADSAVAGNPDEMSPKELHEQAWALVEPQFLRERDAAADRYRAYYGAGSALASADVKEVVPAAYYGRVETLFVPQGQEWCGKFDLSSNEVSLHDGSEAEDQDLLDVAAVHTLLNSGTVYSVEPGQVPGGEALAAILRY